MKITDFRLETYLELMDRPLGDANGPEGDDLIVSSILIIDTDEGISGVAPLGNGQVNNLFKVIEGKDPRETFTHWQNMIRYAFKGGDEGEVHTDWGHEPAHGPFGRTRWKTEPPSCVRGITTIINKIIMMR